MRKALFLTLALFFLVGFIIVFTSAQPNLPLDTTRKSATDSAEQKLKSKKDFSKLAESYDLILSKTQAEFAITFLDLNSREKLSINGEKPFHAASTSKPIVAAYALKQVDLDKISLDKEIGGLQLSERLRLMINISDNNSWEKILDFFGIATIQKFSDSLGLTSTNHFNNSSTTDDLAEFLAKIYQNSILSEGSKNFLLKSMQNTEREDRIPAGVPNKKVVFHKAGTFGGEIHDIGIITHPKNPFILLIFSGGLDDLDTRPKILAEIAKVSWEFANNQ